MSPLWRVREAERYRLDIVGLTSTHSVGSGTQVLERGWTLFYAGVAPGKRQRAGVGIVLAPRFSACTLGFSQLNERVVSLRLWVGERVLTVVCAHAPNGSSEYRPFLEALGKALTQIVLQLGTPLFCWETSTLTWVMTARPGRA